MAEQAGRPGSLVGSSGQRSAEQASDGPSRNITEGVLCFFRLDKSVLEPPSPP